MEMLPPGSEIVLELGVLELGKMMINPASPITLPF
jgi:hypothetical protein